MGRRPQRGSIQEVELDHIKAPIFEDGGKDLLEIGLNFGMIDIEGVEFAAPVKGIVSDHTGVSVFIAQDPRGMLLGERRLLLTDERSQPQSRLISGLMDGLCDGLHAVGKAIRKRAQPVADGPLIAVVDLKDIGGDLLLLEGVEVL